MKSDYRVRAYRFLLSILPYIEDVMNNEYWVEQRISRYNDEKHRKVIVNHGVARIALITSDYVIKWDYDSDCVEDVGGCVDENMAYRQACAEGYGYLLAASTLVTVGNHVFTIMPRVEHIGYCAHKGKMITDFLTVDEWAWARQFEGDLHHGNWGIKNGKAVIIDYAYTPKVMERSRF